MSNKSINYDEEVVGKATKRLKPPKARKKHILPGPAGQLFQQTLTNTSESSTVAASAGEQDDHNTNDTTGNNKIVADTKRLKKSSPHSSPHESKIIGTESPWNENEPSDSNTVVTSSPAWDVMCISIDRIVPSIPFPSPSSSSTYRYSWYHKCLRRFIPEGFTLLSELTTQNPSFHHDRIFIPKIVIQLESIHSHGFAAWTAQLSDESTRITQHITGCLSHTNVIGWLSQSLVRTHVDWIRSGVVLFCKNISCAFFASTTTQHHVESDISTNATVQTNAGTNHNSQEDMEIMLLLSPENIVYAWTPEEATTELTNSRFLNLLERRAEKLSLLDEIMLDNHTDSPMKHVDTCDHGGIPTSEHELDEHDSDDNDILMLNPSPSKRKKISPNHVVKDTIVHTDRDEFGLLPSDNEENHFQISQQLHDQNSRNQNGTCKGIKSNHNLSSSTDLVDRNLTTNNEKSRKSNPMNIPSATTSQTSFNQTKNTTSKSVSFNQNISTPHLPKFNPYSKASSSSQSTVSSYQNTSKHGFTIDSSQPNSNSQSNLTHNQQSKNAKSDHESVSCLAHNNSSTPMNKNTDKSISRNITNPYSKPTHSNQTTIVTTREKEESQQDSSTIQSFSKLRNNTDSLTVSSCNLVSATQTTTTSSHIQQSSNNNINIAHQNNIDEAPKNNESSLNNKLSLWSLIPMDDDSSKNNYLQVLEDEDEKKDINDCLEHQVSPTNLEEGKKKHSEKSHEIIVSESTTFSNSNSLFTDMSSLSAYNIDSFLDDDN